MKVKNYSTANKWHLLPSIEVCRINGRTMFRFAFLCADVFITVGKKR